MGTHAYLGAGEPIAARVPNARAGSRWWRHGMFLRVGRRAKNAFRRSMSDGDGQFSTANSRPSTRLRAKRLG